MSEYTLLGEADAGTTNSTSMVPASQDSIFFSQSSSGRIKRITIGTLFGAGISTAASQLGSGSGSWAVYGSPLTVQVASAAQAVVISSAATNAATNSTLCFGYNTSTQANGIVSLVNAIQAVLVGVGLMKGGA